MSAERSSDVKFEIGHVLFIDIVGYSKLLISEQTEALLMLKEIVRGTEQCRLAQAEGKLLCLPTGDGAALIFRTTPEAPVLCALEISKALKSHPELLVRMGIHSGPVNEITDLNEQANIAGAGINIAQRVMDCGDAGHILLSKRVAEDLAPYPKWNPYLHDLGECEVKHGVKLGLVNFFTEEIGNPEPPRKCQEGKTPPRRPATASGAPFFPRPVFLVAAIVLVLAFAISVFIYSRRATPTASTKRAAQPAQINSKSIAVLPFENLSHDPDNAYFADGIQEEIPTRLSKIADLKVISRTSTQRYKSSPTNLREIAKQLGVANILEGSVQKAADSVRVNVKLIQAASDSHLWADTYDRKLTDIFGVESEIAKAIAETLQAKLTSSEEHALSVRPTDNPVAHQLYLKGRFFWNKRTANDLKKSVDYFNQAIAADPKYALAYVGLADAYVLMPAYGAGAPRDCYPPRKAAAKKALELNDALGEAYTSLARVLCVYDFDFSQGTREFERAIEL